MTTTTNDEEPRPHFYSRVAYGRSDDEDSDGSADEAERPARPLGRKGAGLGVHLDSPAGFSRSLSSPSVVSDPFDVLVRRHADFGSSDAERAHRVMSSDGQAMAPPATSQANGAAAAYEARRSPLASTSGRPMLDFEVQDTAAADRRELLIYAVPLFRDDLVFLPVCTWTEEPPDPASLKGRMQKRLDELQESTAAMFNSMKDKDPGTIQNRLYQVGRRVVEDQSPVERLMQNIPSNVTKLVIYHPTTVPPDAIMERLTDMSQRAGGSTAGKAVLAGLVLPIAVGIDTVIIPGPALMTYYTGFQLYKAAASAVGVRRLTRYIVQDSSAEAVRVNYAGDARLDDYVELSREDPHGVLSEADLEVLVKRIREPSLLQPLLELRQRQLRNHVPTRDNYALLTNHS